MSFGPSFFARTARVHWTLAAALLAGSGSLALAQGTSTLKDSHTSRMASANTPGDTSAVEAAINHAIPRYISTPLAPADAELLRRAYGIEDPTRLYVSD